MRCTWDNFHQLSSKRKIINYDYYANLLYCLSDETEKKQPHLAKKKLLFYEENAPVHTSITAMARINEIKFKLLSHSPYLTHLAPSDYFFFLNSKKSLGGQRFAKNEEVESVVNGSTVLIINRVSKLPVQKLPNLFPSSDQGPIGFSTCGRRGHMVWPRSEPHRIMMDKIIFKFCVVVVIL